MSSLRHPENNRFIKIFEWQVNFCRGNHCAAMLLSLFGSWHDWKLQNDEYYSRANNIAEMHGDGRPYNQNAYIFFSTDELVEKCLGFYGKNAVSSALQLLVSLNVISVHKNPNPRYQFDKTKYFRFYPGVCNRWIAENYPIDDTQPIDLSDYPKQVNRESKNNRRSPEINRPSSKINQPSPEMGQAITNNTNNNTNNNDSINAPHPSSENHSPEVAKTITTLKDHGMAEKHLRYPDVSELINRLILAGAGTDDFVAAMERAKKYADHGFGVRYLVPIVESLLSERKKSSPDRQQEKPSAQEVSEEDEIPWWENLPDWAK